MNIVSIFEQAGFLFYPLSFFFIIALSLILHLSTKFFFIQKSLNKGEINGNSFLKKSFQKKNLDQMMESWNFFERRIQWLSSIASLSTMTGLLGTVIGIYNSFLSMKEQGIATAEVFAAGISTALITTIFGLCIAIPSLFFFHIFEHWIEVLLEKFSIYYESKE